MNDSTLIGIIGAGAGALGATAALGLNLRRERSERPKAEPLAAQRQFDVVLSFAGDEGPLASQLVKDLRSRDVTVWPQNPQEEFSPSELETKAADSRFGILIVSKTMVEAGPDAEELKPFLPSPSRLKLFEVLHGVRESEWQKSVTGLDPQLTIQGDDISVTGIAEAISVLVRDSP